MSFDSLGKEFNKKYGAGTAQSAVTLIEAPRISTGIFSLDLMLGGGFPEGRISEVFGIPGSCLAGETFVTYAVVDRKGRVQNAKGGSLERLYLRFNKIPRSGKGNYQRASTVASDFYVASVDGDGRVLRRRIIAVSETGIKSCVRIKSVTGKTIVATLDHKFMTPSGYCLAQNLVIGSDVIVHDHKRASVEAPVDKPCRPTVHVKVHPYGSVHQINGCWYKTLSLARTVFEATMNNLSFESYREKLNNGDLTGLKFLSPEDDVHHVDENPLNNAPDNLVRMLGENHDRMHAFERGFNKAYEAYVDQIISIEPVGDKKVYDVSVEAPYHNFVAEGFVVHNCKSNVVYKTIASKQKTSPELKNAVVDIENTLTPDWCRKMGIDPEILFILKPQYGEQAVDMVEALMSDPECGVVLLDSLAAMITTREAENSAEKADPGGQAQFGKKLINKVILAQRKAEGIGLTPTFIYINQLKFKIGVMYGDPATTPGGESPKFAASLRLRFYAKDIKEEKWSKTHVVRKSIHVVVAKHKIPIVARECEFDMAMVPHAGMVPGEVDEWKTVWFYLQKHGMVEESGKGWKFNGKSYDTQKAIRQELAEDFETDQMMKQALIKIEVERAYNEQHVGGGKEPK